MYSFCQFSPSNTVTQTIFYVRMTSNLQVPTQRSRQHENYYTMLYTFNLSRVTLKGGGGGECRPVRVTFNFRLLQVSIMGDDVNRVETEEKWEVERKVERKEVGESSSIVRDSFTCIFS